MAETFRSKLSTTRAGERTRIWIEGKRLAEHGFTYGNKVSRKWTPATLTLETISEAEFEKLPIAERGTVSGRRDNPIIDVTGQKVAETFGVGTHVTISFEPDKLTIRRG
jgi:hypothetical protein